MCVWILNFGGRAWINLESTNEGVCKVQKNIQNALKVPTVQEQNLLIHSVRA